MIASVVIVDHISVVISQITAGVGGGPAQVELDLVDAFLDVVVQLVHGGSGAIFTTNKKRDQDIVIPHKIYLRLNLRVDGQL